MIVKKSFTHVGAIISLIILLVLLLFSWDKCIINPIAKWLEPEKATTTLPQNTNNIINKEGIINEEGFVVNIDDAQAKGVDARDIIVDLNPTARQVKVSFSGVPDNQIPPGHKIKSYFLVMAKYDNDLNKVGALDVKLSEEEGGKTLVEDLAVFNNKYAGSLTSDRKTKIASIQVSSSTQSILNAFLGSTENKILSTLGNQPSQEINMFFELLGLVYKYKLTNNTKLKDLYTDLQIIYNGLPSVMTTGSGDPNYDYLSIDPTDNVKAAANLKRAMANYQGTTSSPGLKPAFDASTNAATKPNQTILSALKAFMEELIKMAETGNESATGNICDITTKKCTYTFTQVESTDAQGNIYYYKLGVGVVFVDTANGADKISTIKPYTFGTGNKLQYFRVDTALADQERLLRRLEELERVTAQKALQQPVTATGDGTSKIDANGNPIAAGMDAYINMLKPYLGNYPEEYLLTSAQGKELTLDRYINQSLASGELNINVDLTGLTPATTDMAGKIVYSPDTYG